MKKFLYSFVFLCTSLYAGLEAEDMPGIYMEFGAFLTVIFVMAFISNRISSRHAKEYAVENKERLEEKISAKELKEKDYARYKNKRVQELIKLKEDKVITVAEQLILQRWLYN